MIAKEYIPIYIVLIVLTLFYIKDKRKKKNDDNPMNIARVFDSVILIIILLYLFLNNRQYPRWVMFQIGAKNTAKINFMMNIQRENGIDEVNCAFRMLNMSLDQFVEIQHSMVSLDLDFEVNEEYRNIIIDMNHKEDVYTIIQLCKKFNIKKGNIYCSIISSYDNGGFRLPSYIMYLIKEMQEIELDFSFVVC